MAKDSKGLVSFIFPAAAARNTTASGSFGSGGKPAEVNLTKANTVLSKFSQLDVTKTSDKDIILAAQQANTAESASWAISKISKYQLRTATAAAKILGTQLEHSEGMMKVEADIERLQAKHGKAVLRHEIGREETAEGYNAYHQGLSQARNWMNV